MVKYPIFVEMAFLLKDFLQALEIIFLVLALDPPTLCSIQGNKGSLALLVLANTWKLGWKKLNN